LTSQIARHCFRLQVRPERLADYMAAHEAVWPEMLNALASTGWQNYSIFVDTDGVLIGYFEAEPGVDPIAEMAKLEVNSRWQEAMAPFFDGSDTTQTSGFRLLSEVFNLDSQLHALTEKTEKDK
jgi:L-rhamnose mutarotase